MVKILSEIWSELAIFAIAVLFCIFIKTNFAANVRNKIQIKYSINVNSFLTKC